MVMWRYDLDERVWERMWPHKKEQQVRADVPTLPPTTRIQWPISRAGVSCVVHENAIYMFGGEV
jgi:hypothetical protein